MSRRDLLLLAAVAATVRIGYNLAFLSDYFPISDANHYHAIASNIAAGRGFAHPFPFADPVPQATAFRPPLYPGLLGAAYWLFGSHVFVAQVLNVALGTGVVVLVALVGHRYAGRQAAIAAGGLAAVFPPLLANDGPPLSEPLGLALLLGTVLLLGARQTSWAGLTTGLLVLTRPSAQGYAVVLAVWVLWRFGFRHALRFGVLIAVVVAPWLVRNWIQLDSPVLVTSNGFNLAALYSEESLAQGRWLDPVFDERLAEARRGLTSEVAMDEAFRAKAVDSLRAHPLELVERTWANIWNVTEVTPYRQDAAERFDGRNLSFRYATLPVVWATILLGSVGLWSLRRAPAIGPLVISAVYFFAITLPFSPGAPRLRAPADVALCVGVGALWAATRRRSEGSTPPVDEPAPLEPELEGGVARR
jgi:4-amino-4-deoxy-L-arabinose transferase-like glycosyltransferase